MDKVGLYFPFSIGFIQLAFFCMIVVFVFCLVLLQNNLMLLFMVIYGFIAFATVLLFWFKLVAYTEWISGDIFKK